MDGSVERLLSRVDAQIQAGQLWRAKELLRGAIGSGRVEAPILERYGQLLDSVGDRIEAGKYLFLSGSRRPEYAASIGLFLGRHSRGGPKSLVAQFPNTIRHRPLNQLPAGVIGELANLGIDAGMFTGSRPRVVSKPRRWERRAIGAAVLAILVVFAVGTIVGMRAIVAWLRGLLG
jgi:hypothetical protein